MGCEGGAGFIITFLLDEVFAESLKVWHVVPEEEVVAPCMPHIAVEVRHSKVTCRTVETVT